MAKMTAKTTRTRKINAYVRQLSPLLDRCDDDQRKSILKILIDKIAYLTVCLEETKDITVREGTVVEYNNGGGQVGIRAHPAVQVYTQYSKTLAADLKQLREFLPEEEKKNDELTAFLNQHPTK